MFCKNDNRMGILTVIWHVTPVVLIHFHVTIYTKNHKKAYFIFMSKKKMNRQNRDIEFRKLFFIIQT